MYIPIVSDGTDVVKDKAALKRIPIQTDTH